MKTDNINIMLDRAAFDYSENKDHKLSSFNGFNEGATWQQQKSKAIIDKLVNAMQGFVDNCLSDKRIADNQINYYKGQFNKLLKEIESE